MPDNPRPGFSEEEASRIWRRAADLQARRRLESRALAAAGDAPEESHDLSPDEIVAIAREAGIDGEFVQHAIEEARTGALAYVPPDYPFHVRRRLRASSSTVQETVQDIAERPPFELRLIDIRATGDRRMMVFAIDGAMGATLNAGGLAAGSNVTALHAILEAGDGKDITDLVLYAPPNPKLDRSVRNHNIGFGGFGGFLGGLAGVGIASEMALGGALLLAPPVAGAVVLGGAGLALLRQLQRWSRRKDEQTLHSLADEIAGGIRIREHGGKRSALPHGRKTDDGTPPFIFTPSQ